MQTPPLYRLEQPEPALLRNLAPTPLSLQEVAAVEQDVNAVEQDVNAIEVPAESLLPVLAVDWRRIKIFREKLQ